MGTIFFCSELTIEFSGGILTMKRTLSLCRLLVLWFLFPAEILFGGSKDVLIICPSPSSFAETLAAREIYRNLYLRTGVLLPLQEMNRADMGGSVIVIAGKGQALIQSLPLDDSLKIQLETLGPEQYLLQTLHQNGRTIILVSGGDEAGVLYGTYRFLEHFGIRYYLHGDVIPDNKITLQLPEVNEKGSPLFPLRGIQPFHDFPEGPDWWNLEEYRAILSQLPKLRMNFLGLHTYPEGGPNAEPTTWIGLPQDIGQKALVKSSYPSSYQNTLRGNWGYAAKKTSEFVYGSADLFDRDAYGAEVMRDCSPEPSTPEASHRLFAETGTMLQKAFEWAHQHGVKTCVGTETFLTVPKLVQQHLKDLGKNPEDKETIRELYAGIFQRIAQTYPLDYYWLWTPENWTWAGASDAEIQKTTTDLQAALEALVQTRVPFKLATCGWVLGPQNDRALFDKLLPKDVPVSCINREVGMAPIDPAFGQVQGRSKWAIPWLEDDPALILPQLWAGRMRRDARDALKYGCDGLMGIHWRTRILGPAVAALAQAAWDQSGWKGNAGELPERPRVAGALGGRTASFPSQKIEGTPNPVLYQTMRVDMRGYRLALSPGTYKLTLKFCELQFNAPQRRVFDVKVQGRTILENLDIFEQVGQGKPLDKTFENVEVKDGWMEIGFVPRLDVASICAIVVEGSGGVQKINCGGSEYKGYLTDLASAGSDTPSIDDFYEDWANAQFGAEAAHEAAATFERIDSRMPRPSDWVGGPGGLKPDPRPWDLVRKDYAFVEELALLQPRVKGAGNQDRFEYWLNNFRYLRDIAEISCLWGEFNQAMEKVKAEKEENSRYALVRETALPIRVKMIQKLEEIFRLLLATVSNTGEMGTLANWNQHLLPLLIDKPGEELSTQLGAPLPPEAQPAKQYTGPERVFVCTNPGTVKRGEETSLRVMILGDKAPQKAGLFWRPLGSGKFREVALSRISRGVYSTAVPAEATDNIAFEYYVRVIVASGKAIHFPTTAPDLNQSVVVVP